MPKSVKVKNERPDVLKKKHIVNPYNCNYFRDPNSEPDKKRQTAVFTK